MDLSTHSSSANYWDAPISTYLQYPRQYQTPKETVLKPTRKNVSVQRQPKPQYQRYKKPPYPYIGMIALAIERSPEKMMALCEIRQALMDMFEFFRVSQYRGWRDSVRHNLSQNKCFSRHLIVRGNRQLKKWTVDLSLLPDHAFRLQSTSESRTGTWAPTLWEELKLPSPLSSSADTKPSTKKTERNIVVQQRVRDDVTLTPLSKMHQASNLRREPDMFSTPTNGHTETLKRKRTDDDSDDESIPYRAVHTGSRFSPENYKQIQDMISVSPEHVSVDVATGNLSDLCDPDENDRPSPVKEQTPEVPKNYHIAQRKSPQNTPTNDNEENESRDRSSVYFPFYNQWSYPPFSIVQHPFCHSPYLPTYHSMMNSYMGQYGLPYFPPVFDSQSHLQYNAMFSSRNNLPYNDHL